MATAAGAYPMSVYLGHVDMGFNIEEDAFELRDQTQMDRFIEDAKSVQPSEKSQRKVNDVHARMEKLKQQQASGWTERAVEGSFVTRAGRRTTTK